MVPRCEVSFFCGGASSLKQINPHPQSVTNKNENKRTFWNGKGFAEEDVIKEDNKGEYDQYLHVENRKE